MYLVMIVLLIILFFLCFVIFRGEILYPPIIVISMFLLCSIVGLFRYDDWNIDEYSGFSVLLFIIGLLSFSIISYLVYILHPENIKSNIQPVLKNRIEISTSILLIIILIYIIYDYMFYMHIKHCTSNAGLTDGSLSQIINRYYNLKSYEYSKISISFTMKLLNIFTSSFSIFSLFVIIHNFIFNHFKSKDLLLLFIVLLGIIYSMLNSSRGDILVLLAETVYLLYFFWNMRSGWKKNVNGKIIKWGICVFVIFIGFFLFLTVILGRRGSIKDIDIVDYLTIYISSSIRNFDLFLKNFTSTNSIFGRETFFPLNRLFYNLFGIGEYYSIALDYNAINGRNIGNIYTAFRRYFADFGMLGIIILPAFLGGFFSVLYSKAKHNARKGIIGFSMLIFCYLSTALFYLPIEERFFIYDLSLTKIAQYILLFILFKLVVQKKIKFSYNL